MFVQCQSKEAELKECLISDLVDKRRHAELERNTMEVGGGTVVIVVGGDVGSHDLIRCFGTKAC